MSPGTGWLGRSQEGECDFSQLRKPSPLPWDFGSHPGGRDCWPALLGGSVSAARRPRGTLRGCRSRACPREGRRGRGEGMSEWLNEDIVFHRGQKNRNWKWEKND